MGPAARLWSLASAGMLIICFAVWLGFKIPREILSYPDELLTAERAREMLILGRGSVHFNFAPSFAKPPLQYWLTTFTLPRFDNASTAVRIWPLIYGMLTIIALGWLAFLLDPLRPWLIPLSIATLISCSLFSIEATRALLDTGLTFFTTAAVGLAQLARRRPGWWLGVAIACWLGALQKIPLIFLVWLTLVAIRFSTTTERPGLQNRWLLGSAMLAGTLLFVWPLIQYANYQMPMSRALTGDKLEVLFGRERLGSRPYFEVLEGLIVSSWVAGGFALLAAISFLFPKKRAAPMMTELSIISLSVIVLAVLFNFRADRYVLPIVPCLSLLLAAFLYRLLEQNGRIRRAAITLTAVILLPGLAQAEIKMHHRRRDASIEQRLAEKLGTLQRDGVHTLLIESSETKRDPRSYAFYLFHGKLRFPLKRWTVEEFRQTPPPRPAIGICVQRDFPIVQAIYPEAKIEMALSEFLCWQSGPPVQTILHSRFR